LEEPFFKADTVRSVLAYFVVVWSLAVVFIAAAAFGVDEAMRFSAFFSGLVGVVLGFYFGRHGTEQAIQQVETTKELAAAEKEQAAVKTVATIDGNEEALKALQARYDALEREYAETLDQLQEPKARAGQKS
jgi:uncharacterized membrane-anchored protein YhcB (DUF1043 family)